MSRPKIAYEATPLTVRIPKELRDRLDREAAALGVDRSTLVRQKLEADPPIPVPDGSWNEWQCCDYRDHESVCACTYHEPSARHPFGSYPPRKADPPVPVEAQIAQQEYPGGPPHSSDPPISAWEERVLGKPGTAERVEEIEAELRAAMEKCLHPRRTATGPLFALCDDCGTIVETRS